ncbi:MAG: T9SS type A sorting domain-containing protein, partial [bacterium]
TLWWHGQRLPLLNGGGGGGLGGVLGWEVSKNTQNVEAYNCTPLQCGVSPNPFNPSTTIRFDLPAAALVKLEVFDVSGRAVGAIHESLLPVGTHQIPFDGSSLPSGIYFAQLQAGDFTAMQKLVLLK